MPHYEVTLIMKPMIKKQLAESLRQSVCTMLDHGAVVTGCESLGHRELPYRMLEKSTAHRHFSANYFLVDTFLPRVNRRGLEVELARNHDMLRYYFYLVEDFEYPRKAEPCTLEEEMLPPPIRPSVLALKRNAKMGHFARLRSYMGARKAFSFTPKSFPIAPFAE